jgi:hypothetical protein
MAYGLQVWNSNGVIRLDTTDREFRYVAQYTGSISANSTITITLTGLSTDGTWGINEQSEYGFSTNVSIGTNTITVQNTNTYQSSTYSIQVFRI